MPPSRKPPVADPRVYLSGQTPVPEPDPVTATELRRFEELLYENARRKVEASRLYEPLPLQEEFLGSQAQIRLLRGSNRSGKTCTSFFELSRAVLNRDPHQKFPAADGRAYVVGKDQKHIGEVIHRKLFRAGAFKIIRDEKTNEWRAYKPWQDAARWREAKPAPPLIPPRFVKSMSWALKKENVVSKVVLTTGWEIDFFSSLGKPPAGSDLDLVVFDEEIVDSDWFPEMMARLLDRRGRFWWGATPQLGSDRLWELHLRCEREAEDYRIGAGPPPNAREFVLLLADNPHIDEGAKRELAASLDETSHAVRIGAEFAAASSRVFPEWAKKTHVVDWRPVPDDWTRYAAVDPGRQVCAVLFLAVPPPHDAPDQEVYVYDELYITNADAAEFGRRMAAKVNHAKFEAFIIDHQAGRQHEVGSGKTWEEQYEAALRRENVACRRTQHGFEWGQADVKAGVEACRAYLRPRGGVSPRLRVIADSAPNFVWEVERYRYKRINGVVTDTPEDRGRVHQMACFDAETEVLAESGWVRFANLQRGERVATVNLESDLIEYQQPSDYIGRHHDGPMVKLNSRVLNAVVTPDHRMVVLKRSRKVSRPTFVNAADLHAGDRIKMTAGWAGSDDGCPPGFDPGDLAEFLGWYTAEGCRAQRIQMPGRGYQVVVSQTKVEGRRLIERLLDGLGYTWRYHTNSYHVSNKGLWKIVGECGDGCKNKRVPNWIKVATPQVIGRFMGGYIAGDGWVQNETRYAVTTSIRLADDIQELWIKLGRSASIVTRKLGKGGIIRGRPITPKLPIYRITERRQKVAGLRNMRHEPRFFTGWYDGMVYCVTVPNGTLVVRRGGKSMIAGNCLRYLLSADPHWVEPGRRSPKPQGAYAAWLEKRRRQRKAEGGGAIILGPSRSKT